MKYVSFEVECNAIAELIWRPFRRYTTLEAALRCKEQCETDRKEYRWRVLRVTREEINGEKGS